MSDREIHAIDGGRFTDDVGGRALCACLLLENDHTNPHYVRRQERLVDLCDLLLAEIRESEGHVALIESGGHALPPYAAVNLHRYLVEKKLPRLRSRAAAKEAAIDWAVLADWMIADSTGDAVS